MLEDGIESLHTVASSGGSAERDANGRDGMPWWRRRERVGDGGESWSTELIKGSGNGGAQALPGVVKGFGSVGGLEEVRSGEAGFLECGNYTNGG